MLQFRNPEDDRPADEVMREARRLLELTGADTAMAHLRRAGTSKIWSILLLHEWTGCGIAMAKTCVDASDTWRDRQAADAELHDELWRAARRVVEESGGTWREHYDGAVEAELPLHPPTGRASCDGGDDESQNRER